MERARCVVKGCNNVVTLNHKSASGKPYYRKMCSTHHRDRYNMPHDGSARAREQMVNGVSGLKKTPCTNCGWSLGSCHLHRKERGGSYTRENIVVLCPNCHQLVHSRLLNVK